MIVFITLYLLIILALYSNPTSSGQYNHDYHHSLSNDPNSLSILQAINYVKYLKRVFTQQYSQQCHPIDNPEKYSWIEQHISNQYHFQKYTIFIWEDQFIRPKKGGFGDRLAGLITAFLWSVRANRTFLIESTQQPELFNYFQPFPYYSSSSSSFEKKRSGPLSHHRYSEEQKDPSHSNHYRYRHRHPNQTTTTSSSSLHERQNPLKWSNWGKYYHFHESLYSKENKTYLWCINPKSRQLECAFDDHHALSQYAIVRIRLNRCYLCRWMTDRTLPAYQELHQHFNITEKDNLFQVAGCILRNILWPTNELWREITNQITSYQREQQRRFHPTHTRVQKAESLFATRLSNTIGIHFRCGDHNYQSQKVIIHSEMVNHMACRVKEGEKWNGTMAVYEYSSASPIDMGQCASLHQENLLLVANHSQLSAKLPTWFYITSDSMDSSDQIYQTINHPIQQTIVASNGCHYDYNPSKDCIIQTIVAWFLLSMNNRTIVQSYYHSENDIYLPASSFARYAMIYSLQSNTFDFGDHCYLKNNQSGKTAFYQSPYFDPKYSRLPQGNWVCMGGNTIY